MLDDNENADLSALLETLEKEGGNALLLAGNTSNSLGTLQGESETPTKEGDRADKQHVHSTGKGLY